MPRINDAVLYCTIYLYASQDDASSGEHSGGSGFLVSVPSPSPELNNIGAFIYAVTNSHVIKEGKASTIRFNTSDGKSHIVTIDPSSWYHHPDGDDLAITPFSTDWTKAQLLHIPTRLFVSKQLMADEQFGAGDEVFIVGRFIGYDGKQRNEPIVRFGNLSTNVPVPIPHDRGINQDSFLVDIRSLPGFSGSPVFIHRTPFTRKPTREWWSVETGPWLLGVDWGHKHTYDQVLERQPDECGRDVPVDDGWRIRTNSGIACVVPAWKLEELLNIEALVVIRKKVDRDLLKMVREIREPKQTGTAMDTTNKDSGITRKQFHDIINKAS